MRCPCAACHAGYDRRYVSRVDRGWPRWLAYIAGPPASRSLDAARAFLAEYSRAWAEGRVGVGILGAVVTSDRATADEITRTFGLRSQRHGLAAGGEGR